MRKRLFPILLVVAVAGSVHPGHASDGPAVSLTVAGDQQVLYEWNRQRCDDEQIPDSPARAFRRADGEIVLIATHRTNWALIGSDFASLRPSCETLLRGTDYPAGTGKLWIQATYTYDGKNVAALVSQDLAIESRQAGCDPAGRIGKCWLNKILAARSSDMGRSFDLFAPKDRVVVSLSDRYPEGADRRYGAFTTTNIVRKDDAFYTIVYMQGSDQAASGNCLFRTSDPMDAGGWRALSLTGFDVDVKSDEDARRCVKLPHLGFEARSLAYSAKHGVWIAVLAGRFQLAGDDRPVAGFYASTSPDLKAWSKVARIMRAPIKPREERPDQYWYYPSLIDPDSTSANFDTIDGDTAVLLFTVGHLRNGRGTMNRDLQYVPVRLEASVP
ncbi:hypothetical protein PQJ75_08160 [Rhodoplanes sp. TEM]|uniref:DUF4185 domain-containing protein n=1 Tax=Rhodoplanes tepidamans TaxID=200616 RepID=A0ABT5JB72_RHOTP|nr:MULTISPECIES: hypothetical protein [Rhodoplanes]MDC7786693.1 hypothetical protein [Rhodoplanes tepidamans]MDC7983699.1 hypothetical protein [Rhodoplanes sp. TEM]MDQ0358129.1 hypothetical protein [Rhodoplanes tepidamans]